ncbi:MAG: DUF362 domain-containing protein [Pirellulaceae bacterium]|nr:DUF362 domain-containing protein [Pirellulaceae bacterium]
MSKLPKFFTVCQHWETTKVSDIQKEVEKELSALQLGEKVRKGQTVAITAGSRGIANISLILRSIVDYFKKLGAVPFLVTAMGSHGGATAQGQREVLENYGITEEYCGCEIRSDMETIAVCRAKEGFEVHMDRHAWEADHLVVCNRVKPHTGFTGDLQSGLMKMLLIGLGKHKGATIYHRAIKDYSFGQIVRSVVGEVVGRGNLLAGLGVVENAYEETSVVWGARGEELESLDKKLLQIAADQMPTLPFPNLDILLIDEIGKNISGTGMDTNVVGRKFDDHRAAKDEYPKIKRILVRGLTQESKGNATGIGMSEFCLSRVVEAMDLEVTNTNCLTSGHVTAAMIPIHFQTDREMLEAALGTIGLTHPEEAKIVWVPNTLKLDQFICSKVFENVLKKQEGLTILSGPKALPFGENGLLVSPFE